MDDTTRGGRVRAAARKQRAECRICRDYVEFTVDRVGRLIETCPHCHEGRPHSRSRWLARFAIEDAAMLEPAPEDTTRWCAWCGSAMPEERPRTACYCSKQCVRAAAAEAKRARIRAIPPHACATAGCTGTTRSTYCRKCSHQMGANKRIQIMKVEDDS